MAQIKIGTVSVTNGSNVVTGTGTQWLTDGVQPGDGFVIQIPTGIDGAGVYYTVGGSVTETGLNLASNWAGDTGSGLAYVIIPDFIAPGYPNLLPGDLEVKPIINSVVQKLLNQKADEADLGTAAAADLTTSATDTTAGRVLKRADRLINETVSTDTLTQTIPAALNSRLTRLTLTKSVAGGVDVTLTASEAANRILIFTGALTANINVIVPSESRQWLVINNTTGAFTLTVKTALGVGVAVPQGLEYGLRCDGTDVIKVAGSAANKDTTTSATDTTAGSVLQVGAGYQQLDVNLYHKGNILGTVSQSGGVPTGAIIERGSNANGEYVKFADGRLECRKLITGIGPITTAFGSDFISPFVSGGNYASTDFIATPEVFISSMSPAGNFSQGAFSSKNSLTSFPTVALIRSTSNASTDFEACLLAIGRWY